MKIKVLHIQLLPLLSGVQNMMLNLIENLGEEKFKFYVISASNGPLVQKLRELKIEHFQIPELRRRINIIKDIMVFLKFYQICIREKFDIVHTHSSKTGFLGRIAAKLAGIKVIVHTIHGFPFNPFQNLILQNFYKTLEKTAEKFCDKVISVNESERELAVKEKIIPKDKIITIFNGISKSESFSSIPKNDLGFRKSDTVIGYVSRFSKQKNIIDLIKVAIEIVKCNENIKFIFIGDGELWNNAKNLVESAKMSVNILLPGWKNDIPDWLGLFDIFILYSKWEGLSLSILEAMSGGKPIIASKIKGNNELVFDGKNGFLVEIGNHKTLKEKIVWLANHKNEREKMGLESKKLAQEKFSLENFVNSYKNEYIKLYQKKL